MLLKTALFWAIAQRVVITDISGQPIGPISKITAPKKAVLIASRRKLEMIPMFLFSFVSLLLLLRLLLLILAKYLLLNHRFRIH